MAPPIHSSKLNNILLDKLITPLPQLFPCERRLYVEQADGCRDHPKAVNTKLLVGDITVPSYSPLIGSEHLREHIAKSLCPFDKGFKRDPGPLLAP